jgi:predicted phosphodiesterase
MKDTVVVVLERARDVGRRSKTEMAFYVLQLSDIHFTTRIGEETTVHDDVRRELVADIRVLREKVGQPVQAVTVTGDIAFSGRRSEYELAAQWLDQIIEACGCSHSAVLTVPGNHDVDRDRIRTSAKLLHRSLRQGTPTQASKELAELMTTGDALLLDKLHDYQAFAACYGTPFDSPAAPNWVRRFELSDTCGLDIIGLSTVQVCDANDTEGAMFLGSYQYIFERTPNIETIVLMHHPIAWLRDRQEADQYLASRAKVLIYGHEHLQTLEKKQTANGHERLVLGSGAVTPEHAADPYTYRYNLLGFEHVQNNAEHFLAVTVFPRVWSRNDTRFRPDWDALNGSEFATFRLKSAQFGQPPLSGAAAQAARAVLPLQTAVPCEALALLRHLFWRHLDWRARIGVLVGMGTLPPAPETPLSQHIEASAIAQAEATNRLSELWSQVMERLPVARRLANPFE